MPHQTTATEILQQARSQGMPWKAPIDVYGIAQMLGARVVDDATLEDLDIIGKIMFTRGVPLISINPDQNRYEPRRRFTLAHELGHLCLHALEGRGFTDSRRTMSRTESYWDRYESEANNFAAELLMPAELLYEFIWNNFDDDHVGVWEGYKINQLAQAFEVSTPAMEYRLNNLGLLRR